MGFRQCHRQKRGEKNPPSFSLNFNLVFRMERWEYLGRLRGRNGWANLFSIQHSNCLNPPGINGRFNSEWESVFETSQFTKFLTGLINVPTAKRALTANQWLCAVSQLLTLKWPNQAPSMVIIHVPSPLLFKNARWGNKLSNNQGLLKHNTADYINFIMLAKYVRRCKSLTAS